MKLNTIHESILKFPPGIYIHRDGNCDAPHDFHIIVLKEELIFKHNYSRADVFVIVTTVKGLSHCQCENHLWAFSGGDTLYALEDEVNVT